MRPGLVRLAVFAAAAAWALYLFGWGLSVPLQLRARGDAYVYLAIANGFDSFGTALSYLGDRTAGMPLFDYAVRRLLWLAGRTDQLQPWVDLICAALLAIHLGVAWAFSRWIAGTAVLASRAGAFLLFAFLATFPALVGHTTTPLSDTLAIDLVLAGCVLLARGLGAAGRPQGLAWALAGGLLLGFSILVRASSWPGIAAGLAVAGMFAATRSRSQLFPVAACAAGCLLALAPFLAHCAARTGSACLQSPAFPAVASAQGGLLGGRTLWMRPSPAGPAVPTLPDAFMAAHFFDRCRLETIAGVGTDSLTGCLASRPLAVPVYAVKKWIGLFDHFRFTPYLERDTPAWLRALSRGYDTLAWAGFALGLAALAGALRKRERQAAAQLAVAHPALAALIAYTLVTLLLHTMLHVEDRYGFPLLPLSAVALLWGAERALAGWQDGQRLRIALAALLLAMAAALFWGQILAWDIAAAY